MYSDHFFNLKPGSDTLLYFTLLYLLTYFTLLYLWDFHKPQSRASHVHPRASHVHTFCFWLAFLVCGAPWSCVLLAHSCVLLGHSCVLPSECIRLGFLLSKRTWCIAFPCLYLNRGGNCTFFALPVRLSTPPINLGFAASGCEV